MEMEIGSYCSVIRCNRRDFLPFTCDGCKQKFCQEHKTYSEHLCEGISAKSISSIDCPICGESVKFALNENVDERWAQHYSLDCTKKAAPIKVAAKCPVKLCNTVLGISNFYGCPRCN